MAVAGYKYIRSEGIYTVYTEGWECFSFLSLMIQLVEVWLTVLYVQNMYLPRQDTHWEDEKGGVCSVLGGVGDVYLE